MLVCLAIQIHSSRPISTKVGMKHPWWQGQTKVRLLMLLVKVCSAELNRKNRKCPYLGNCRTNLTKVGVCMHAECTSIILKNQDNGGAQYQVTAPKSNCWINSDQVGKCWD